MAKQLIFCLLLVCVSTMSYYIPTLIASGKGIDLKTVPQSFLNHHAWRTSGAFLLTTVYSLLFFIYVPEKSLIIKIFACHLFLMEAYSFIMQVLSVFIFESPFSLNIIITTLISLSASFLFFSYRAVKKPKSDSFNSSKTYVIRTKPKNFIGFLGYILDQSGHKSIYQDKIYAFKRSTKTIVCFPAFTKYMQSDDITLKEIPRIKNIDELVGKRFNLLKFNCYHLERYGR